MVLQDEPRSDVSAGMLAWPPNETATSCVSTRVCAFASQAEARPRFFHPTAEALGMSKRRNAIVQPSHE